MMLSIVLLLMVNFSVGTEGTTKALFRKREIPHAMFGHPRFGQRETVSEKMFGGCEKVNLSSIN